MASSSIVAVRPPRLEMALSRSTPTPRSCSVETADRPPLLELVGIGIVAATNRARGGERDRGWGERRSNEEGRMGGGGGEMREREEEEEGKERE